MPNEEAMVGDDATELYVCGIVVWLMFNNAYVMPHPFMVLFFSSINLTTHPVFSNVGF